LLAKFENPLGQLFENLIPVIVLNPSLSNWKGMLEKYDNSYRIKTVKILPNYHNYSLSSSFVSDLMKGLNKRKIPLIIQVRLEDERSQYPLLILLSCVPVRR